MQSSPSRLASHLEDHTVRPGLASFGEVPQYAVLMETQAVPLSCTLTACCMLFCSQPAWLPTGFLMMEESSGYGPGTSACAVCSGYDQDFQCSEIKSIFQRQAPISAGAPYPSSGLFNGSVYYSPNTKPSKARRWMILKVCVVFLSPKCQMMLFIFVIV